MNPLTKILEWLRPPVDPEAEAQHIRESMETVRTSRLNGPAGHMPTTVVPTPDVLDPKSGR